MKTEIYVNEKFKANGRIYKFGKYFGKVPKNKTCAIKGFRFSGNKITKEGEVFFIDMFNNILYVIE